MPTVVLYVTFFGLSATTLVVERYALLTQSFITKLAAGISTIISSAVYAFVGYSGANVDKLNRAIEKGANFITYDGGTGAGKYAEAMFFLISIPPAIGMLLSALPTLKYAMSDKEHQKILETLVEKRNTQDTKAE